MLAGVIIVTLYPRRNHILSNIRDTFFMKMLLFSIFSDYEAFKEAAEQFQPYIKFFATFDKSVSHRHRQRDGQARRS